MVTYCAFLIYRAASHHQRRNWKRTTTKPSSECVKYCPGSFSLLWMSCFPHRASYYGMAFPHTTQRWRKKLFLLFPLFRVEPSTCAINIHLHSATFSLLQRFFLALCCVPGKAGNAKTKTKFFLRNKENGKINWRWVKTKNRKRAFFCSSSLC